MKINYWLYIVIFTAFLFQSCLSDIRTDYVKENGEKKENKAIGKNLLKDAWKAHGLDKVKAFETYQVIGKDEWRGFLGKLGKPWPNVESKMEFNFEIETFNSSVRFLDGKRKDDIAGLQSWHYYEIDEGGVAVEEKMNKRIRFGLSAYQYFFEMVDRLMSAPIITYAGETVFNDKDYELVFVTWHKQEPHRKHDQYLLYLNKETKMLDLAIYTLRENYLKMPGGQLIFGSIEFNDYRNTEGVQIPFQQTVYINAPNKDKSNVAHIFTVESFKFDAFSRVDLLPLDNINETGDSKTKG